MTPELHLRTDRIGNQHVELEFLVNGGPRITGLYQAGSRENLFVEIPKHTIPTPLGDYHLLGGHRLWHAPEAMPRTYVPDDQGLVVEKTPTGVLLQGPTESATGIRKSIEIQLENDSPTVTLYHGLHNAGLWPVELAPWSLTQLPLGGLAILPQITGSLDPHGMLPNRQFALWPYSRWADPRLHLDEDFILISGEALLPPFKLGYLNRDGWLGYLRAGVFFRKRFEPKVEAAHVDFGCNAEVYCNEAFVEIETIGPSSRLEPGQDITHVERWDLLPAQDTSQTREGIRTLVRKLA